MSVKEFCTIALWHLVFFVVGIACFIFLFHAGLLEEIDILFYRGIVLLVVSCVLLALLMIFYRRKISKIFTYRDIILVIVLFMSVNLVFFTHLPVTAERSISVFLLGYLNNYSRTALTDQEMTQVFVDKYVSENGAIEKRLREQVVSGNIIFDGSGYKISKRGERLMKLYTLIANFFKIDKRLISP